MDNWHLYKAILKNSEGLEALQNNIILPKEYVRYSDALFHFERQAFYNFLCQEDFKSHRIEIDLERIFRKEDYLKHCSLNKLLKDAEELRWKARNIFNEALAKGFIKSVIFKFDENKNLNLNTSILPKSFWGSAKAFNIDTLSLYFIQKPEKFLSEGLIALDRKSLEKWGAAYPNDPNLVGRKKGAGKVDDSEALKFMKTLVLQGNSVHKAAIIAVDKYGFKGASYEADIARLRRKYPAEF